MPKRVIFVIEAGQQSYHILEEANFRKYFYEYVGLSFLNMLDRARLASNFEFCRFPIRYLIWPWR